MTNRAKAPHGSGAWCRGLVVVAASTLAACISPGDVGGTHEPDEGTTNRGVAAWGIEVIDGVGWVLAFEVTGHTVVRTEPVAVPVTTPVLDAAALQELYSRPIPRSRAVTRDLLTGEVTTRDPVAASTAAEAPPFEGTLPSAPMMTGYVGEADARTVERTTDYPYRTAVKLILHFGATTRGCSGVLVHPHHVMTAGHCVFNIDDGLGWVTSIEVIPAFDGGARPYGTARSTHTTSYTGWTESDPAAPDYRFDQAYVSIDRNFGDLLGYLGTRYYDESSEYVGLDLNMNHYPGAPMSDGQTQYHGYDEVTWADDRSIHHSIDSAPGSSGSGIYRYSSSTDERHVLANHSWNSGCDDANHCEYNGGVRLNAARWDVYHAALRDDPAPADSPDLADSGTGAVAPGTVGADDPLRISFTVNNMGTVASRAFEVRFYLSEDEAIGTSDTLLGTTRISEPIAAFGSSSATVSFALPRAAPGGPHFVGWIIDPSNDIAELDEDNNVGLATPRITIDRDLDHDGHDDAAYGGDDCDDRDPDAHPGATEVCDGADNDCDGRIDEGVARTFFRDADGDGFGATGSDIEACGPSATHGATVAGDCDDADPTTHPDATEVCDDVDNDCDGERDEGAYLVYHLDADRDGYGDPTQSIQSCWASGDHDTLDATDCDDRDPGRSPGAAEGCDGIDNDCDGELDEGPACLTMSGGCRAAGVSISPARALSWLLAI